jgi:hypothetical protein
LRALRLPLNTAPLLLIVIFSLALSAAAYAGLFGVPLALILASWYLKYSFAILDAATVGAAEPPVLSVEMINPLGERRSLVLLAIVVFVFFASGAARYWFGDLGAAVVGVLAFLAVPGIIAIQGFTGSIVQSLNPRIWLGTVRQLGTDYLRLLAGIAGVCVLAGLVLQLPLTFAIAGVLYCGLAIQGLIGGLLFEHRRDDWFDEANLPIRSVSGEDPHLEKTRDLFIDALYAEWRNGAHQNAWRDVVAQYEKSDEPLEEMRWIYRRIAIWPDPGLANRLAQELVPRLLAARNHSESFDIVRKRLAADRNFRPIASSDLIRLATLARDVGDRATARALLREFDRFYPNDPQRATAEELTRQVQR